MTIDYGARLGALRRLMDAKSVGALLASVGADLPYLTGYEAMPLERLTMLVVTADRPPVLLVPQLEAPRVRPRPGVFELLPWGETEDPVGMVARLLDGVDSVKVGDQTWATFVLALQQRLPATRFDIASPLTRELRMRKDPEELDALRRAAHATDRVAARLKELRFSGRTEAELSRLVADLTIEEGHQTATFSIVASGPNGASPHHEAGERLIAEGDGVVVDFGGKLDGYCSDTTRTFHVGEPTHEYRRIFTVLEDAQAAAVDAVRPGFAAQDIDRTARAIISGAGLGEYFIHRTGHGIGLEAHEHPYIVEGNGFEVEAGMTFSIEPGIYLPGRFGMRIEDIVAVTEDGVERLNRSPRGLAVVD
ncbi:MAG: Xaa-Pro peptidase family protein [Acidimicrobiia bacterium]|nr:Xaa-Pro peptidase family protein [Acidimicrobiia bacterium]